MISNEQELLHLVLNGRLQMHKNLVIFFHKPKPFYNEERRLINVILQQRKEAN